MISHNDMNDLIQQQDERVASIFAPMAVKGQETRKNPIRFKNALQEVEQELEALDVPADEIKSLLKEPFEQVENHDFWQHQNRGLAVFISPGGVRYESLPFACEETALVSERPYLRPLLPLFVQEGRYHLLAFHQDDVALYSADRYGMFRVPEKTLPDSIAKILAMTDVEANVGFHATGPTPTTGGTPTPKYHGQGDTPKDYRETEIEEFVRQLAGAFDDAYAGGQTPLVLAAEPKLQAIFRNHARYPGLLDDGVGKNPSGLDEARLHEASWNLVAPALDAGRQAAVDIVAGALSRGDGDASAQLSELVPAAMQGRIGRLLVTGREVWGRVDPATGVANVHNERRPGDSGLVDFIAARTMLNGGAVHWVENDQWDFDSPAVAQFRY